MQQAAPENPHRIVTAGGDAFCACRLRAVPGGELGFPYPATAVLSLPYTQAADGVATSAGQHLVASWYTGIAPLAQIRAHGTSVLFVAA